MARTSNEQREVKREKTVKRFAEKRTALKKEIQVGYLSEEGSWDALEKLNKLPRNASPSRLRSRCKLCGRPRGVYRKFGLCRCCLRKYAMQGFVPGLTKASW